MTAESLARIPEWAQDAVWYQIFVERFRNGDPSNDPSQADLAGAYPQRDFDGWTITPWGWDWYAQEPWAEASGEDFWVTVQNRRFGGDLAGVMEKLPYLDSLGVTAIYFNPINDAPSLHKYDVRTWRHVDRNFGPDPEGDRAIIESEDPLDPATWRWTSADSLFLAVLDAAHARGMRVILDYSWNHTGRTFWAWRDVLANGADSRFAEWYEIESFDDPSTPEDEFEYRGWAGVPELPEVRKIGRPAGETHGAIEGTLVPEVRDHVFAVTRRWLDPNGDGDPSDGVDGFRLDVAEMVPLGFWREYRAFVRGLNPDALLVGEVWWETWPDRMYDPAPWLQGDVFDAVMNYRWYQPVRSFFARAGVAPLTASELVAALERAEAGIPEASVRAQMNLTASHDSPRFATSIANRGRYKYRVNPRENAGYDIGAPSAATKRTQRLVLLQQFTWRGAPHVWNGDELGMWGADDPDNRKPLLWPDLEGGMEQAAPPGGARDPNPASADLDLLEDYRAFIALRRAHAALWSRGATRTLHTDDDDRIWVYERTLDDQSAIVAFNAGTAPYEVSLPAGPWRVVHSAQNGAMPNGAVFDGGADALPVTIPPMDGWVLMRETVR